MFLLARAGIYSNYPSLLLDLGLMTSTHKNKAHHWIAQSSCLIPI